MNEYESRDSQGRDGFSRFGRYLRNRPAEVWVFFAVGIVIGMIFG